MLGTQHPRRASTKACYTDPPEFDELDDLEDDEVESEVGNRGAKAVTHNESSEEDDDEPTPKRRKKSVAKKGKGKAKARGGKKSQDEGKLKAMGTLPVELLVEIFSHLDPPDLLALSVVNKNYRSLLTTASSHPIWKAARERFELPKMTAGGFTELQYAQLMFGSECQSCGAGKVRLADFYLRRRWCKYCRKEKIVRLDFLKRTHPHLHPLTRECVISSDYTPGDVRWRRSASYGTIEDLEFYSAILWELQDAVNDDEDQDDKDGEAQGQQQQQRRQQTALSSARSNRRSRPRGRPNYVESSDDEDVTDPQSAAFEPSRKVAKLIASRKPLLKAIHKEGTALVGEEIKLHDKIAMQKKVDKHDTWLDRVEMCDRADEIEERVLELNMGFNRGDFHGSWYSNKLVMAKEPLTDEIWEDIKPRIIKLLERIRRDDVKKSTVVAKQARQRALRPRYEKLKHSLPPYYEPYLPLFVDFLLFDSVKPLWVDDGDVTDEVWGDALPEIIEEVEQYRVDLTLHTREVILAATADPDAKDGKEEQDEEDDNPDLSDAFFKKATSYVACAFTNCNKSQKVFNSKSPGGRDWVGDSRSVSYLSDVLQHQHKLHNLETELSSAQTKNPDKATAKMGFRVHLPQVVADSTWAMVKLAGLEPETAKGKEMDEPEDWGHWEWENAMGQKRKFYDSDKGWVGLLRLIKTEADKAAKSKPPRSLPAPLIVFHPITEFERSWREQRRKDEEEYRRRMVREAREKKEEEERKKKVKSKEFVSTSDEQSSDDEGDSPDSSDDDGSPPKKRRARIYLDSDAEDVKPVVPRIPSLLSNSSEEEDGDEEEHGDEEGEQ
ncbi:hypothetical protein JCM8547_009217 [Rhodosporidiobolus lusitaniae]